MRLTPAAAAILILWPISQVPAADPHANPNADHAPGAQAVSGGQAQGETGSRVPLAPNSFLNQGRALDALRKGQSKPLEDIETAVGSRLGVKIIDVKLVRRGLRLI